MRHGGDLGEASAEFGEPPGGWLDLSTGTNPRPYPIGDIDFGGRLSRFPARAEVARLIDAARAYYRVSDLIGVAVCPGTELVIRSLPFLVEGGTILLSTSYSSYRDAWQAVAREFYIADTLGEAADRPSASVVIVNPNNPDGRICPPHEILELARQRTGAALVIVDEAYADTEGNASVIPHLRRSDRILVLRSFGKFFGLPGLRLGFAVGPIPLIQRIASFLGDWPISAPAALIGAAALADTEWQQRTRHWLGNQSQAVDSILLRARLDVAGGTRLFRYVASNRATSLHKALGREGIWTRSFDEIPDALRIGLPAETEGLNRLAKALLQE